MRGGEPTIGEDGPWAFLTRRKNTNNVSIRNKMTVSSEDDDKALSDSVDVP